MRRAVTLALALSLAACGQNAPLKPAAGKTLPVAAYGADAQADAEALLKTTPQAAPERSVELRKRSEDRAEDPFDLPPPEDK
ncbi:hypothetical protein ACFFF7_13800 [Novosphingobium aquiterrae]|uniref:Argininosuccinate lyase n=1 Tax=Novosphingobium aquiterrae TaxID=624388 RepID=A0ABV6PKV3_9SPHN